MGSFILSLRHSSVQFLADTRRATAIEYGMIAALLSILILAGAQIIGVDVSGDFAAVARGFP